MTQNSLTDKEYYGREDTEKKSYLMLLLNSIIALTISIGKAFNSFEAPVKSKHGMFVTSLVTNKI